ncbi:MAG: hypothetical protein RLZZ11_2200 [Cyanobacteriota bacterium]
MGHKHKQKHRSSSEDRDRPSVLDRKLYETELARLQVELVKMQYWAKATGFRLIVLFEGRDAAGKGGTIKRITEPLNPRGCRVVWRWARPVINSAASGISSVMSSISPQPGRSCCSIAVGITAPVWSG